jgi:hypothetical protein
MRERAGDALAPVILALIEESFDKEAARITEDRDQQEDPHLRAGDRHPLLAEINLQLVAWRRFHAYGRELRHPSLAAKVRHRSLDGPDTDGEPTLSQQAPHHNRIPVRWPAIQRPRLEPPIVGQPPRGGADLAVGLELPILALIPGLGNVAWRPTADLR